MTVHGVLAVSGCWRSSQGRERLGEHPAQPQGAPSPDLRGGDVTPPETSQIDTRVNNTDLFNGGFPPISSEPGFFLCDRITVIFPVLLPRDVRPSMGKCWFFDGAGEPESFRHRRLMVEGSWTRKVSIEVHDGGKYSAHMARLAQSEGLDLMWLRLDGNPMKWFQYHNVFGSPDVWNLTNRFVDAVMEKIGLGVDTGARSYVWHGYYTRLDACMNFDLGSEFFAASLVRQLGRFATILHRKSSTYATSMVFPGRSCSLSIYHKGPELKAHPNPVESEELQEVADRIVRFEVVSRSEALQARGLQNCSVWAQGSSHELLMSLWSRFVSRMRFPRMSQVDLSVLKPAARRFYSVWLSGQDVHACGSRMTVWRHRAAILEAGGPDIALPKPAGDVIEFRRVLAPIPASVPASLTSSLYRPIAA